MESAIIDAWTPEQLAEACGRWGAPPAPRLIRAFENFVYAVDLPGQAAVLRITHASHRDREAIEAELAFVGFLASRGLPACAPIPSQGGRLVEAIGDHFHAVAFVRADGARADRRDPQVWNADLFRAWGRTLAAFHRASRDYEPPSGSRRRQSWSDDDIVRTSYLPPEEADLAAELRERTRQLAEWPRGNDRFGLIHADVHSGNFHVDAGGLQVFDFDDSAYHWYAYDLTVALLDLAAIEGPPDEVAVIANRAFATLLAGYQGLAPLPPDLGASIRFFMRFRELQLLNVGYKKRDPQRANAGFETWFAGMRAQVRSGRRAIALDCC